MEEIQAFKCKICGEFYDKKSSAYECEYKHARENYANCLLKEGYDLDYINRWCGFGWRLSEEQKRITKDNCFIISHWQCCDRPAYRITGIEKNGYVDMWGCGSWSGYYGHPVSISDLPKPHPKEELFVDERYGKN
jgi:hypothetical protein